MAKLKVGVPLYPNFDSLDVCGPYQTFTYANMDCFIIGPDTTNVVTSFEGVSIRPNQAFDGCPQMDVLFVPGGSNPVEDVILKGQPGNNSYLDFLAKQAKCATWVCSVCTGSLLLAAAGQLNDYTCTTHWVFKDVLRLFKCQVVDDYRRYVRSGNRITGGGIASGLDESFYIVSVIFGIDVARMCQLKMQYRPDPIIHCGDPGDIDIRDNPGMVQQVLSEWGADEARKAVAQWLAK